MTNNNINNLFSAATITFRKHNIITHITLHGAHDLYFTNACACVCVCALVIYIANTALLYCDCDVCLGDKKQTEEKKKRDKE